jgi:hypothetical protein
MRNEIHTKNLTGHLFRFLRALRQLDAAAFAPATGVNLRFDDYDFRP